MDRIILFITLIGLSVSLHAEVPRLFETPPDQSPSKSVDVDRIGVQNAESVAALVNVAKRSLPTIDYFSLGTPTVVRMAPEMVELDGRYAVELPNRGEIVLDVQEISQIALGVYTIRGEIVPADPNVIRKPDGSPISAREKHDLFAFELTMERFDQHAKTGEYVPARLRPVASAMNLEKSTDEFSEYFRMHKLDAASTMSGEIREVVEGRRFRLTPLPGSPEVTFFSELDVEKYSLVQAASSTWQGAVTPEQRAAKQEYDRFLTTLD
ncbi:MAG: hypothetical protein AAF265_10335 [Pseudomonadota bacterium]